MNRFCLIIFTAPILLNQCNRHDDQQRQPAISNKLPFNKSFDGIWQIGYSPGNVLANDLFQPCVFSDTSQIIGIWHPSNGSAGYYPYLGQNRATTTMVDPTGSWAARAGEIVMEGSNSGQYSMLRFIAPTAGSYKVKAVFEGIHFRLSSTDVHILVNSKNVFSDFIEGYGGDISFHTIEGNNPAAKYEDVITLKKNDIITFAVGYGKNMNHFNDTNGLLLDIKKID